MIRNSFQAFVFLVAFTLVIAGVDQWFWQSTLGQRSFLQQVKARGFLNVVTRYSPTIYYEGRDGPEGFEYELVRGFARSLGVLLSVQVKDGIPEVLDAIDSGYADLAVAGLTRTEARAEEHLFGPGYYHVQQQVVCRRGSLMPEDAHDLVGKKIAVVEGSSYEERLKMLKKHAPQLTWSTFNLPTEQLLEKVWNREFDCTIADSNVVSINRRYYPELAVAFAVSEIQPLGWIIADHAQDLEGYLERWTQRMENSGQLATIKERYYGHVELFDYVDISIFHRRIQNRLSKLRPYFEKYAKKHNIPWVLLAAQAYQESHWNRKAKSPTGVRGVMMLTQNTARAMGVTNRLSAQQSIRGGAQYLSSLWSKIPEEVPEEDRWRYALAAYNVGLGHLKDAIRLATQLGKDPYQWTDLKTVLPLLSVPKYYRNLRYGYARGSEPVRYVERIYNYYDILKQHLEEGDG